VVSGIVDSSTDSVVFISAVRSAGIKWLQNRRHASTTFRMSELYDQSGVVWMRIPRD